MEECIFCQVAKDKKKLIYENEKVAAFNDIRPVAPIHILIIPKKHIASVSDLREGDKELMGELILAAKKIAEDKNLKGYKLAINVGRKGGQIIDHIHLHLLCP